MIIKLIKLLNISYTFRRKKQLLKKTKHLEELQGICSSTSRKAGSNIIIVCKKYYVEVVLSELKDGISNQNAYELVDIHVPSVIYRYLQYMSSKNIKIPLDMEHLPCLYWLPKLHKNPYGCRFIAASSKCTTNPLPGSLHVLQ